MLRFPNCFASSFDASASSCGMSVSSISMIVTSLPKRLKIDANSQPMMPPPRIDETLRLLLLREQAGRVDAARRVEAGDRRPERRRAGRDDRLLEVHVLPALDRDRVRVVEAARALHPLDAVRLEEAGDALRHLLDDAGLPGVRRGEVERRLADAGRRTSRSSPRPPSARRRSAPTLSSECSRRGGTCRRAPAPSRCTRPSRRAVRRGSRRCSRRGRPRGRRRQRPCSPRSRVRSCEIDGSHRRASIVTACSDSPTVSKPNRS